MVVACLGELAEKIDAVWACALVVGEAEAFDLFDLCGALSGAFQREQGYRVDALVEADALQEEGYWILPEEAVEEGDLSDLVMVSIKVCVFV